MYLHAIFHDMSKFSPKEFFAYAKWFYGRDGKRLEGLYSYEAINNGQSCLSRSYLKCKKEFTEAVQHHYAKNKHHWNHWLKNGVPTSMPSKYIDQMICDWTAMGQAFGNTAQEYYLNNYSDIKLDCTTRLLVEMKLDLNDSPLHNYGHTLKHFVEIYDEEQFNKYFGFIKEKYNVDIYNKLKK